jgi:glycosyltransferase involved in cell wall biosynthesis
VVAVYNERPTIEEILRRIQQIDIDKEVIVVDDASTDGTAAFLKDLIGRPSRDPARELDPDNIRVIFQERNTGKGKALRRGFSEARGEIIIVQDADLEYDPRDYHRLIEPIEHGVADVVYGSRFLGGPHRVLLFWHTVGNRLLTLVSNILTNLNLSDVWTGYKAFRRSVLETIRLAEDRFGFEPEVTAKVAKAGWRLYEVPISYHGRTYAQGKKITWKDGVKGIWCTIRYGLFAR